LRLLRLQKLRLLLRLLQKLRLLLRLLLKPRRSSENQENFSLKKAPYRAFFLPVFSIDSFVKNA
jgi:hypothetical protein